MKKNRTIYSCTMASLYLICNMAWAFCRKNLAAFAAFDVAYTEAFVDDQLTAVKAAELIEDEQMRQAAIAALRMDAEEAARLVCDNWQTLKFYTGKCFPADRLDNALKTAGSQWYATAYTLNWPHLQALINAGNKFISDNIALLTTKGKMPGGFDTQFAANAQDCMDKYTAYIDKNGDVRDLTADKIDANNAIYTSMMRMLKDARQIFKKEATLKSQSSFRHLKETVCGNGAGSIRGKIVDGDTGKVLAGVTVTVATSERLNYSNKRGGYKVNKVAAGSYKVEFSKEGYETVTTIVDVSTSTMATCDATLTAVVETLKVA